MAFMDRIQSVTLEVFILKTAVTRQQSTGFEEYLGSARDDYGHDIFQSCLTPVGCRVLLCNFHYMA